MSTSSGSRVLEPGPGIASRLLFGRSRRSDKSEALHAIATYLIDRDR
jgi:hypothetical protein